MKCELFLICYSKEDGGMKTVLLAGGFGTRISEESEFKPKPMIEIGGMPILWHIMKIYSSYGFDDFIVCAGYKQHIIKEWFNNYFLYTSDVTFDFTAGNSVVFHEQHSEPWKVTVVDTGLNYDWWKNQAHTAICGWGNFHAHLWGWRMRCKSTGAVEISQKPWQACYSYGCYAGTIQGSVRHRRQ